jgi:hypothetical protein
MKKIRLTQGLFAFVDDEDYERLSKFLWHVLKAGTKTYAVRKESGKTKGRRTILMHREVVGLSDENMQVDHIDQNGLNNTKDNLRVATAKQNRRNRGRTIANKTGYKGVRPSKNGKRWVVFIDGEYLGTYDTAEEAATAYDKAALARHREFACLNFLPSQGLTE